MKKKFKLTDLDCANCAAKMEDAIRKIEGVENASVSFMTLAGIVPDSVSADRLGYHLQGVEKYPQRSGI